MIRLDANEIVPGLFQGAQLPASVRISPHERYVMKDGLIVKGFDVVVLCAKEIQPHISRGEIDANRVIHAPLDDGLLSDEDQRCALWTTARVVEELRKHRRVLVTCAMGLNRSGLICALVLCVGWGLPASEAIRRVRARRSQHALFNQCFVNFIEQTCATRAA